jgi:hypothetical protein
VIPSVGRTTIASVVEIIIYAIIPIVPALKGTFPPVGFANPWVIFAIVEGLIARFIAVEPVIAAIRLTCKSDPIGIT